MAARARNSAEGDAGYVTSALLALLIGERQEAETALLRARAGMSTSIEGLIEMAWAFFFVESGHPRRAVAHAARARQAGGLGKDAADPAVLQLIEAQAAGPGGRTGRELAAQALQAIPAEPCYAALHAWASLVTAGLAFESEDTAGAESALAAEPESAFSGLLAGRADLLRARIRFARGGDAGQAARDLSRAIDRFALLGARRDLGLAYLVRASYGSHDALERAAWLGSAQPLLGRAVTSADLRLLRLSSRYALQTLEAHSQPSDNPVLRQLNERRSRLEAVVVEHCEAGGEGPCNAPARCPGYEAIDDVLGTVSEAEAQLALALEHSLEDRARAGQLAAATQQIASLGELAEVIEAIPRLALVVCPASAAELLQAVPEEAPRLLSRQGTELQAPPDVVITELRAALAGRAPREGARPLAVLPLPQCGPETVLLLERVGPGWPFSTRDLDQLAIFAALAGSALGRARASLALRERAATDAATLGAIRDGVVSLDAQGLVASVNEAAAGALGVRREDLLGHRLSEFPSLAQLCLFLAGTTGPGTGVVPLPQGQAVVRYLIHEAGAVLTIREPPDRATARRAVGAVPRFTFEDLWGRHPSFLQVLEDARKAAFFDSPLVISGESGTGKEMLAQAIHNASPRAASPFLAINVTAIPRELLESELFGYDPGAFTGARSGGLPGKFELAGRGTLVLDEIGDMPLELQAKILRVLQEMAVQRLGSSRDIPVRARVLATTNRDLERAVAEGRFRLDLFHRLCVMHLRLPPLRERRGDVRIIVDHLLARHTRKTGRRISVTPGVLAALEGHTWPGNVRELVHALESELNLLEPGEDALARPPRAILRPLIPPVRIAGPADETIPLGELERRACEAALLRFGGNVATAARALGVARGTLYAKIKRYNIPLPETAAPGIAVPRGRSER